MRAHVVKHHAASTDSTTGVAPDHGIHARSHVRDQRRRLSHPLCVPLVLGDEVRHAPCRVRQVIEEVAIEEPQRLGFHEPSPRASSSQPCIEPQTERAVVEKRPPRSVQAGVRRDVSEGVGERRRGRRKGPRRGALVDRALLLDIEGEFWRAIVFTGDADEFLDVGGVKGSEGLIAALCFRRLGVAATAAGAHVAMSR